MKSFIKYLFIVLCLSCYCPIATNACSRITYTTPEDTIITGRTMDWAYPDHPILTVSPRNEQHKSTSPNGYSWKAKYGSVAIKSTPTLTSSGVNEKQLEIDLLWLGESTFEKANSSDKTIYIEELGQFILDNFENVNDVEKYMNNKKFKVISRTAKNVPLNLHIAITDNHKNNLIVEYVNGQQKMYKITGNAVMTNDPSYDKMLAIKNYYKDLGIERNAPGSSLSQARFLRAESWLEQISTAVHPKYMAGTLNKDFESQSVMSVLSIMRAVSTPLALANSNDPNNDSTVWRSIIDLKNNKFYFDSALVPTTIWVDLNAIDYTESKQLDLSNGLLLNGDITSKLK